MQEGINLGAQPLVVQVIIALCIGLGAILTAYLGYRKRVEREPPGAAQTVLASIPDMSAVRQLTETCRVLCERIEQFDAAMRDHTHYLRNKIEVDQELCMRLRELKEEIIRSDRQRSRRVSRPSGS